MVRVLYLVVVGDFFVVYTDECLNRCAGAFCSVYAKCLYILALKKVSRGNNLGQRDAALPSTTANCDFHHRGGSYPLCSVRLTTRQPSDVYPVRTGFSQQTLL